MSPENTRSKALVLSTAIPHAADWLNFIPSHALGLHLHDWEFRLCLQYWLGLQMVEEGARCPICQVVADPLGDHQVGCGGNGDRIHRHDSVWDALFSAAQTAALAPRKEVPSLIPGTSSRPANVYLPNWMRGQPAAIDVHVISTLQQLTLKEAAVTQGHALSVGEERKRAAHSATPKLATLWEYPSSPWWYPSSPWWWRPWEVGVRRQLSPSRSLDGFRASDWEFPPPKPPHTFFSGWPLICEGATPPSGSVYSF